MPEAEVNLTLTGREMVVMLSLVTVRLTGEELDEFERLLLTDLVTKLNEGIKLLYGRR